MNPKEKRQRNVPIHYLFIREFIFIYIAVRISVRKTVTVLSQTQTNQFFIDAKVSARISASPNMSTNTPSHGHNHIIP